MLRSDELSPVQPSFRQPDSNSVMHEHLHSIGPTVGEEIGVVGMSRIEYGDHVLKHCIKTGAHVERVNREPDPCH
jgi:hypothetical protein